MLQEPFFQDKKILVIEQSPKTANDRTWCFWEKEAGLFEPIVHHRWQTLRFYSGSFSKEFSISPYQYKMIRGIDLYALVKKTAAAHTNVEWRQEKVTAITTEKELALVTTDKASYTAEYVFNSIHFGDIMQHPLGAQKGSRDVYLLQHFKGWVIETTEPVFDAAKATFMDFRVSQEQGTTFFYVLPVSPTTALVEYTLFTEKLLPPEAYDEALKGYIESYLKLKNYTIQHEEFGVIPMTNHRFPLQQGRVVYTGIAGGQAKGSSGYAFRFIQKRAEAIVRSLAASKQIDLHHSFTNSKFALYDSVLLQVLAKRKMPGSEIFAAIFRHNPPQRVLRFLDNESSLLDDLQIMCSVPTAVFLPAALQELTGKGSTFTG